MAKVIFINAKEQKVEIKNVTTLETMSALVEGYIERVPYIKGLGHSGLVVNEEGLYKGFTYGFTMDGNVFMGNGFIGTLGKTDTKIDPATLIGRISYNTYQVA
jgi:hypothetical protein